MDLNNQDVNGILSLIISSVNVGTKRYTQIHLQKTADQISIIITVWVDDLMLFSTSTETMKIIKHDILGAFEVTVKLGIQMEMSGPKSCEALASTCGLRRSLDGCLKFWRSRWSRRVRSRAEKKLKKTRAS